jgi:formylglycine-generating enzyme required for sulfatase activity
MQHGWLRLLILFALVVIGAQRTASRQAFPAITVKNSTIKLVRIPAGEFERGSEREGEQPRHLVKVRGFALGATEVTVRQFRAFVEATGYRTDAEKEGSAWVCRGPQQEGAGWRSRGYWETVKGASWRETGFPQTDDHPVVALSWQDAVEFCQWLSRETGQEFRLPSEAEWEYAARAGSRAEAPADLEAAAWFRDNSQGATHPVGRKQPNAWGVSDMLGNAWEWTADIWAADYRGAPADGSPRLEGGSAFAGIAAGDGRALRGGAWGLERAESRYAARSAFGLHQRCNNSGFRVARSLPAP